MEQYSIFSKPDQFWKDLQNLLDELIISLELPKHSLHLYSNISAKGKNAGKEVSRSICIYEPEYPLVKEVVDNPGRNSIVLNVQANSRIELSIRDLQFSSIPLPDTAEIAKTISRPDFTQVFFGRDDINIMPYIKKNIIYCLQHYRSKEKSFGCCSQFEKCSDAKKCVHTNKLYSTACLYRHHLESGRIFYGKNKNV